MWFKASYVTTFWCICNIKIQMCSFIYFIIHNERRVSCQRVYPHVSEAPCGYTSFHKYVITISGISSKSVKKFSKDTLKLFYDKNATHLWHREAKISPWIFILCFSFMGYFYTMCSFMGYFYTTCSFIGYFYTSLCSMPLCHKRVTPSPSPSL